jgi:hypothetical protein
MELQELLGRQHREVKLAETFMILHQSHWKFFMSNIGRWKILRPLVPKKEYPLTNIGDF